MDFIVLLHTALLGLHMDFIVLLHTALLGLHMDFIVLLHTALLIFTWSAYSIRNLVCIWTL